MRRELIFQHFEGWLAVRIQLDLVGARFQHNWGIDDGDLNPALREAFKRDLVRYLSYELAHLAPYLAGCVKHLGDQSRFSKSLILLDEASGDEDSPALVRNVMRI